jgi:hypothetical protein
MVSGERAITGVVKRKTRFAVASESTQNKGISFYVLFFYLVANKQEKKCSTR